MISCVIIDDEKPAREALQLMLTRYFPDKVRVTGIMESLKEGVLGIYKYKPDLVFLDIEMPEEDGFKIFNYFQQVNFSVIFTTAYKDYAIKAIKVAALDYILKPVGIEDLREALSLFEKRKYPGVPVENIEKLVSALNPQPVGVEKIALPTINGYQLEKINSIMYCEADQNYTKVHSVDGSSMLISKPLNTIQELLPHDMFFRIHKSLLVNLNYIKTYSRKQGFHVVLEDGTKLDVAGRRNDDFIRALTHK